jgi:hypothetical protein
MADVEKQYGRALEHPHVEHYVLFVGWTDNPKRKSKVKRQIGPSIDRLFGELARQLEIPGSTLRQPTFEILEQIDSDQALFIFRVGPSLDDNAR